MSSNVLTSRDAELRLDGVAAAKATDVSLTLASDLLDKTTLGQKTRTRAYGLRDYSGSCTLLYDRSSQAGMILRQAIDATDEDHEFMLYLIDKNIGGTVLFGQVNLSAQVGNIVTLQVSISFNEIEGNM
jgi:hypothetical protein